MCCGVIAVAAVVGVSLSLLSMRVAVGRHPVATMESRLSDNSRADICCGLPRRQQQHLAAMASWQV